MDRAQECGRAERTILVGDPTRTLREAKAIVQADWGTRLL